MQRGPAAGDARGEESRQRGSVSHSPAARPNPGETTGSARAVRRGDKGSGDDGQQATRTVSSDSGIDQRVAGRQRSATQRTNQHHRDERHGVTTELRQDLTAALFKKGGREREREIPC
ncbi:hypothetical protein Scep_002020 [Stephania cephalantha]|uniref:Uncharacterized protein n=1 Tax=Stephania cephalantha TaxID=152367 RepID=A0AAP0LD55_9MAGN